MNQFKIKYALFVAIVSTIAFSSCKDYLDVNVNPNASTSSRIDLQLTSSQLYTSIGMGQRMFPNLNIWAQYQTGGPGVSLGDPDQHLLASSEGNELFRAMYRGGNNLNFIIKNNAGEKNYVAIAKILKAFNFQICVDMFGNIPYSEALKGDIPDGFVVSPSYDDAATVYAALEKELTDAIALINEAAISPASFKIPAGDDLIFGGDMTKWKKFAYTTLLKMSIRQDRAIAGLSADVADYITTNADAAFIAFPGGSSGSNPAWNAAKSTALGNFYVATTTSLDYLGATQDPRIDYFYDKNGSGIHFGLKPGDVQNAPSTASFSRPAGALAPTGGLIFGPKVPVFLISAWESNLLLAEAAQKGWITAITAEAAYEAGVKENFLYLGVTDGLDTTYLQNKGKFDTAKPFKSIAYQKWVCMTGIQPLESWIETRRNDNSDLPLFSSAGGIFVTPTKNALGGSTFPSILPYPESEESLNPKFPGQHPLTAKVFWDK
jgi:Starch-binding associating with outer membrane